MAKFKIRFKLQGLELDVEGSREDIPEISRQLANQLTGLVNPAMEVIAGSSDEVEAQVVATVPAASDTKKRRKRKTFSANNNSSATAEASNELNWVHDPQKWGAPSQSWNTAEKCMWLLYVVEKELATTEMSQPQISATFNKHFKQSKLIKPSNVSRDLGKKKSGKDALVGENTTKSPSTWFLTDAGRKAAEALIAQQPA